ncbi:MAG TPA: HD domain-containing phosphohydrolase [Burkholderiaceae bacterium]|nr:HD domain-containing phosphohydrolase [Burkholderiaceae bacterium]
MSRALEKLSFAELRDHLKARADQVGYVDDIDLSEALRHLTLLPDQKHTRESGHALIELGRNYFMAGQQEDALLAGTVAARIAITLDDQLLLCRARSMQGVTLRDLGRFSEATAALAETWMLARAMGDVERTILAIQNIAAVFFAMAQWEVAAAYNERARAIAAEHGRADDEFRSRNDYALCAHNLGAPHAGLRALLPFDPRKPTTRSQMQSHANAHDTLAHLYLAIGNTDLAKVHAQESGRCAELAGVPRITHLHEALLGLINVKSGIVEEGLAAIHRGLDFAKRADAIDVADYLSMCIDGHETAGQSDKALLFLQELVTLKKKSVHAELLSTPYSELKDPLSQNDGSMLDGYLLFREQRIQRSARQRVQHYVNIAINAELVGGHDLYRTFRVSKLSRYLAEALEWDHQRVDLLTLGAQLCNIGMVAVPSRILLKPGTLSSNERQIVWDHARYGAALLRQSKLQVFDVAAVLAEQHHEHYDGTGYPNKLCGEVIAEEARVVAISDAFDAMTHQRPWRGKLSAASAIDELKRQASLQFDPRLVDAFVSLFKRELAGRKDLDAFLAEGADEFEYVRARTRMDALLAASCLAPIAESSRSSQS